ncbi:MAG: hypothetical protein JJU06_05770 [Ectothiorhodospiraceae bacterium]|nr:hypothetical protein [Ectothiorhodospiraceae bacterium]MCH8502917.1 hypothetical protein [Ectothiorhodospiraceae bacterium]
MIGLTVRGIQEAQRGLDAYAREAKAAQVRTIRKTTRWAESQLVRAVARASGVPAKVLRGRSGGRGRIFRDVNAQDLRGSLWLGVYRVKAGYLGTVRQMASGAKVGSRPIIPGSFAATMRSGHTGIFQRSPNAVRREANNVWGSTELPIDEETLELSTIGEEEAEALLARVPERYREISRQELRFARVRLQQRR